MSKFTFPFTTKFDKTPDELKELLGGKGANLNRMVNDLGLPVPPGFTIPTTECGEHKKLHVVRPDVWKSVKQQIAELEKQTGRTFGDPYNPLLVSVRSGAKFSMPGMMDTILNLGLSYDRVNGLANQTNKDFAWDAYRRFMHMYGTTVMGIDDGEFKVHHDTMRDLLCGAFPPARLSQILCEKYDSVFYKNGVQLPDSQWTQLDQAIMAVFRSWQSSKAKSYRKIEGIPSDIGTAVNVQVMVFGNMNEKSGTGVAFTRNPNNGNKERYGDFLVNAQGEDVVAGTHKTTPLSEMGKKFPKQAKELEGYMDILEGSLKDMCDLEFTIENGKLWMLQVRAGKRAPAAGVKIATDLASEGLITPEVAAERIAALPVVDVQEQNDELPGTLIGKGLAACPGIATGVAVFSSRKAVKLAKQGIAVILIREQTNPEDVEGMSVAAGILTAKGGLVSHAAVVARGWGKPCVVGSQDVDCDVDDCEPDLPVLGVTIGDLEVEEGTTEIHINGETGEIFAK